MPGSRKISLPGRSELTTIQITGYSITRADPASTTWITSGRIRAQVTDEVRRAATVRCRVSVVIEHPVLRGEEVRGGEDPDDHEQEPRHRGRVAHVEIAEAPVVEVEREEHGRVRRPTAPPGD